VSAGTTAHSITRIAANRAIRALAAPIVSTGLSTG